MLSSVYIAWIDCLYLTLLSDDPAMVWLPSVSMR
jgi:hypothetical protein